MKKSKNRDSVDHLPPITHRSCDQQLYQKQMVLAETDRLNKKVSLLKKKPSSYFTKVIGLTNSSKMAKVSRKEQDKSNKSTLLERTESSVI